MNDILDFIAEKNASYFDKLHKNSVSFYKRNQNGYNYRVMNIYNIYIQPYNLLNNQYWMFV